MDGIQKQQKKREIGKRQTAATPPHAPAATSSYWTPTYTIVVILTIVAFAFGYFFLQGVFSSTAINVSINVNPESQARVLRIQSLESQFTTKHRGS